MIRSQSLAPLLVCGVVCVAQAQTPAPDPAQTTATAAPSLTLTVPQSTCVKPEIPMAKADSRTIDRFNKSYKAYAECVNKYVAANQALIDKIVATGKGVIDEYNSFNEELKARQEAK